MGQAKAKLPKQFIMKGGELMPSGDGVDHCYRCGKPVDVATAVVLEQDQNIAEWHDFGMCEDFSDGFDLFGADCARAMRIRALHFKPGIVVLPKAVVLATMRERAMKLRDKWSSNESIRLHFEAMVRQIEYQLAHLPNEK